MITNSPGNQSDDKPPKLPEWWPHPDTEPRAIDIERAKELMTLAYATGISRTQSENLMAKKLTEYWMDDLPDVHCTLPD